VAEELELVLATAEELELELELVDTVEKLCYATQQQPTTMPQLTELS